MKIANCLLAIASVTAVAFSSCTASDPDNGLDINVPADEIFEPDAPENPLNTYYLKGIESGHSNAEIAEMPYSVETEYLLGTTLPHSMNVFYPNNLTDENHIRYSYSFEYESDSEYPAQISITRSDSGTTSFYNPTYIPVEESRMYDIVFKDGVIESCKYGVTSALSGGVMIPVVDAHTVSFTYKEGYLTEIRYDDKIFTQEWNAEGDLVRISSPVYGNSSVEYSTVINRYGQWDPTFPFMGQMQVFGWFGKTSVHFPRIIRNTDNEGNPHTYQYDYNISGNSGLFTNSKITTQSGSVVYNYSYEKLQ